MKNKLFWRVVFIAVLLMLSIINVAFSDTNDTSWLKWQMGIGLGIEQNQYFKDHYDYNYITYGNNLNIMSLGLRIPLKNFAESPLIKQRRNINIPEGNFELSINFGTSKISSSSLYKWSGGIEEAFEIPNTPFFRFSIMYLQYIFTNRTFVDINYYEYYGTANENEIIYTLKSPKVLDWPTKASGTWNLTNCNISLGYKLFNGLLLKGGLSNSMYEFNFNLSGYDIYVDPNVTTKWKDSVANSSLFAGLKWLMNNFTFDFIYRFPNYKSNSGYSLGCEIFLGKY